MELIAGNLAHSLLNDDKFLNKWSTLYQNCPHATIFQDQSFICTWYETYRDKWQPVIIQSCNSTGNFIGLWLLAYNPETRTIAHAGAHQAEYHVWLSLPGEDIPFLSEAWAKLKRYFYFTELHFKYLPSGILSDILKSVPGMGDYSVEKRHRRPLLYIDDNVVKTLFSKRSKQKLNHLKKMGEIEFRRISDSIEFEQIFDELILFYDFRMGASNNIIPFQKDQLKRKFYSQLLYADKDSFFVSVTYLNNRPIAGGLSGLCKGTMHLYIGMHSPFLSMYSPGIIHMLQLCEHLHKEKINLVDLTPGGDLWKERFATTHDEVAHAIVFNSGLKKKQLELKNILSKQGKLFLIKIGIQPNKLKSILQKTCQNLRIASEIIKSRKWGNQDRELRMYIYNRNNTFIAVESLEDKIKRNSINDLLSFISNDSSPNCYEFLYEANTLMEKGASSYSVSLNNCLTANGWILKNQTVFKMAEIEQTITLPTKGDVLFGLYSHPKSSRLEINKALISHMLKETIAHNETENVYIFVQAKNILMRQAIETMDFQYQESYFIKPLD